MSLTTPPLSPPLCSKDEDCGKCIKVRGTEPDAPGKWVTIMVVDGESGGANGKARAWGRCQSVWQRV